MSGLGPEDVDLIQVHDAATIGELQQLEALQIVPAGEAWQATTAGRTALTGDIPTNTDGGLLAMGHPFGATGIRMIHETVIQLRQEAGPRQIPGRHGSASAGPPSWAGPVLRRRGCDHRAYPDSIRERLGVRPDKVQGGHPGRVAKDGGRVAQVDAFCLPMARASHRVNAGPGIA